MRNRECCSALNEMEMAKDRWGIYIDIEGFGHRFAKDMVKGLTPLNALMEGIFLIGTKVYINHVERLFAHQLGDGFVIVSCFGEDNLNRPLAIAVSLMRHVLASGGVAKASIAEGGFSDISSCYPKSIREHQCNGRLSIGYGVMSLTPVMGTALINCVGVDKKSPSGALLTIRKENIHRVPPGYRSRDIDEGLVSINWLIGEDDLVSEISKVAGLENPPEQERFEILDQYISQNELKPEWIENTTRLKQATYQT